MLQRRGVRLILILVKNLVKKTFRNYNIYTLCSINQSTAGYNKLQTIHGGYGTWIKI